MAVARPMRARTLPKDLYPPILKAYVYTFLFTVSPQLASPLIAVLTGKRSLQASLSKTWKILRQTSRLESYPACAAILVAASTVGPKLFADLLAGLRTASAPSLLRNPTAVRFLSVFGAALGVFALFNRNPFKRPKFDGDTSNSLDYFGIYDGGKEDAPQTPRPVMPRPAAGKTLFTTSFAVINACVAVTCRVWDRHSRSPLASNPQHVRVKAGLKANAPSASVIVACAIIMHAWFYTPERLPPDYVATITSLGGIDQRLKDSIQACRSGDLVYGKDTGHDCGLGGLATDLGYPASFGDHSKVVPIPCELVHGRFGANCEWNAVARSVQGWLSAMRLYLPLNLLLYLRRKPAVGSLVPAFASAAQSSAFIGGFIGLFYYGVCLARSRVGPLVLGTTPGAYQRMDGGICVSSGSLLCGWAIMLERPSKREELALFLTPRALSALLPERYDRKYLWREQLAFALSTATILASIHDQPSSVRGVFGGLVRLVYA